MTCIDHCIRPPRLIMVAALLSITISLPATAAVSFFSTDNTTKNIAITTSKMNMNMNMRNIFHSSRRKLQLTTTTTNNSADDEIDAYKLLQKKKGINATTTVSLATKHVDTTTTRTTNYSYNNNNELCTPMEECELCPHKWKQLLDKDDEKIEGEFESCVKYGRRQQFKCTVLFQENEASEKVAQSKTEFKPCRFTESDEEFRMLQMQFICLLVGLFSVRNVRRHRVSSASLFDQRRMMRANASQGGGCGGDGGANDGGDGNSTTPSKHAKKNSGYLRKDSLDTIELGPLIKVTSGANKVPKSPAPFNMNSV